MAELQHDLPIAVHRQPLARHRRAQRIPADPLEPRAVPRRDRHAGMQIEALPARVRRIRPDAGLRSRPAARQLPMRWSVEYEERIARVPSSNKASMNAASGLQSDSSLQRLQGIPC